MTKKTAITADVVWILGVVLVLLSVLNLHNLYITVAGIVLFAIGNTIGLTAIIVKRPVYVVCDCKDEPTEETEETEETKETKTPTGAE